jgi:hypothetical protein
MGIRTGRTAPLDAADERCGRRPGRRGGSSPAVHTAIACNPRDDSVIAQLRPAPDPVDRGIDETGWGKIRPSPRNLFGIPYFRQPTNPL